MQDFIPDPLQPVQEKIKNAGYWSKSILIPPVPGAGFHPGPPYPVQKKRYAGSPPCMLFSGTALIALSIVSQNKEWPVSYYLHWLATIQGAYSLGDFKFVTFLRLFKDHSQTF